MFNMQHSPDPNEAQGHPWRQEGPTLLSVALSHKGWLTLAFLVTTLLAYLALSQLSPTYEADSQVLLEADVAPVIDIPNVAADPPDGVATLESAVIVMRSPEVFQAVAAELDLATREEFNSDLRTPGPVDRIKSMVKEGLATLLPAPSGQQEQVETPRDPVAKAARALRDHVSVRSVGESRIIEITATSRSAELAAAISNSVAQQYIDREIAVKRASGDRATTWLDERAKELRAELEAAEARLTAVKRSAIEEGRPVTIDLEARRTEFSAELVQLEKRRLDLRAQREEVLQLLDSGNFATLAGAVEFPTITALVEQIARIDGEIIDLREEYGDHPRTLEAEANRRRVIALLEEETARLLDGFDVRIAVLDERIAALKAQLRSTSGALVDSEQDALQVNVLESEVAASRDVYQRFLLRQKEARERGQFQLPGVRLVSEAAPPSDPVAPEKAKLSLLAGMGGMGAVLLVFMTAPASVARINDPALARKLAELAPLLSIPRIERLRRPPDMLAHWRKGRDIQLNDSLGWLLHQVPVKSSDWSTLVVVTSAERSDGRSSLSLLLAEKLSRDYSTLLVNADRHDTWFKGFARSRAAKTSNLKVLEYSDETLDLIDSEMSVESTVQERRDAILGFEVIIVDAPAMPMQANMLEICQVADHVILTCAWDETPVDRLSQCVAALSELGIHISALALNKVPRRYLPKIQRLPAPTWPLQITAQTDS